MYGRAPESMEIVGELFQQILANHPADKVIYAFEKWLQTSQEFPTPADIINLIKRNGKPPIKESQVIAIYKKQPYERTVSENHILREWEHQQEEGWGYQRDEKKDESTLQENIKLRARIKELEAETERLNQIVAHEKFKEDYKPKPLSQEDKIRRTIAAMKADGCSEEDINEFVQSLTTTIYSSSDVRHVAKALDSALNQAA